MQLDTQTHPYEEIIGPRKHHALSFKDKAPKFVASFGPRVRVTHSFHVQDYQTLKELFSKVLDRYSSRSELGDHRVAQIRSWMESCQAAIDLKDEQQYRALTLEGLLELDELMPSIVQVLEKLSPSEQSHFQYTHLYFAQAYASGRYLGAFQLEALVRVIKHFLEDYQRRWLAGKDWIETVEKWMPLLEKALSPTAPNVTGMKDCALIGELYFKEFLELIWRLASQQELKEEFERYCALRPFKEKEFLQALKYQALELEA